MAKYSVGKPDGPLTLVRNYCEDCMTSIYRSMPAEIVNKCSCDDDMTIVCHKCAEKKGYFFCPECLQVFGSRAARNGHVGGSHMRKAV